jgi:CBS domain-containing protein
MSLMTRERLRHLPVMEGKALIGMISIGDLVKHVAEERAAEVRHLTGYITGERA